MRPSGTEPKIKFYYYAVADEREASAGRIDAMRGAVTELIDSVE